MLARMDEICHPTGQAEEGLPLTLPVIWVVILCATEKIIY
jgi:hypothetical protein